MTFGSPRNWQTVSKSDRINFLYDLENPVLTNPHENPRAELIKV
jgi:hypothetical protein